MLFSAGDLESGVKVHVFKCQKRRKREGKRGGRGRGRERDDTPGHAGCVLGLAVSSDGKFLVSVTFDIIMMQWVNQQKTSVSQVTLVAFTGLYATPYNYYCLFSYPV